MDKITITKIIRLLFYPVTLLLTTPFYLIASLWGCLKIFGGKQQDYPHIDILAGFNGLFYRTRTLNLKRYGVTGSSPYMGLGKAVLSRWFHYTHLSLFTYSKAGALTVLVGMFAWWGSHIVWMREVPITWVAIVAGLALISSTFYIMIFKGQNYNVLGWMFLPLVVYGISTNNWILVSIGWLLISLGSFTVAVIGGILSLSLAVSFQSFTPILAFIPAGLKLLLHLYPLLVDKQSGNGLLSLMKAIGMTDRDVIYKRDFQKKLSVVQIYWFIIYTQFFVATLIFVEEFPALYFTGLLIFLMNTLKVRFADEQSILMMMFTLATAQIMVSQNIMMLVPYWIVISTLPQLTGLHNFKKSFDMVQRITPASIAPYLDEMNDFLNPVAPDSKVLMAYGNPNASYENVFDGYRHLIELPSYVANNKRFHLFPEWLTVYELNYRGAPEIWGREVVEVKANAKYWKADYVIIYQNDNKEIDAKWEVAGFEVLTYFDWPSHQEDFKQYKKITLENLSWWLLKYKG